MGRTQQISSTTHAQKLYQLNFDDARTHIHSLSTSPCCPIPLARIAYTPPPPPSGRVTLLEDVPDENTGRTARKPRAASPRLAWHSFMDACVGRMAGVWRETDNGEGVRKVVQSHGPFKVMLAGQSCAVLHTTALRHDLKRVCPSNSRAWPCRNGVQMTDGKRRRGE